MERLIKSQYWKIVWILVSCLALMILVLPRVPDKVLSCPLWIITVSEWLFALIITIATQFPAFRQSILNLRIQPGCYSLGLVLLIGAIAVIFSPTAQLGENGTVSIGIAQLAIINFAIFLSILTIEQIHHSNDDEAITQASHLHRVTSNRLKHARIDTTSRKGLTAPTSTKSAATNADSQVADHANVPDNLSSQSQPTVPKIESMPAKREATVPEVSPELKRLQALHAAKPPKDPGRTTSRTASQLQALSASGVGRLHPLSRPAELVAGLDQSMTKPTINKQDNPSPVQADVGGFAAAPELPANSPSVLAQQTSNIGQPITAPSDNIAPETSSLLFKKPIDKDMDDVFAKIAPNAAPDKVTSPIQTATQSEKPENITVPVGSSSVFKQSVDKDMDDLFAKIVPAEAQKEVKDIAALSSKATTPQTIINEPLRPNNTPLEAKSAASPQEISLADQPRMFKEKVDDQIEQLFAGITAPEAQREVQDKTITDKTAKKPLLSFEAPERTPEPANRTASEEPMGGPIEHQNNQPANNISFDEQATADLEAIAQELKDFGRLSMKASGQAAPAGPVGTMKTIGKLLIDSQDIDNIIKRAESGEIAINLPSARVISAAHGEGIQTLLQTIDNYQGVVGSLLVGSDGLVIASTLDNNTDRESTGALAHGLLGNTNLAMLRLDLGNLEQMMLTSNISENNDIKRVTTVLTDVGVGMFAVFLDREPAIGFEQLLEKIRTIANG